jgi:hypothetical protein
VRLHALPPPGGSDIAEGTLWGLPAQRYGMANKEINIYAGRPRSVPAVTTDRHPLDEVECLRASPTIRLQPCSSILSVVLPMKSIRTGSPLSQLEHCQHLRRGKIAQTVLCYFFTAQYMSTKSVYSAIRCLRTPLSRVLLHWSRQDSVGLFRRVLFRLPAIGSILNQEYPGECNCIRPSLHERSCLSTSWTPGEKDLCPNSLLKLFRFSRTNSTVDSWGAPRTPHQVQSPNSTSNYCRLEGSLSGWSFAGQKLAGESSGCAEVARASIGGLALSK